MTITLKIVLILCSLITLLFVVRKIRKSQLRIEDAVVWILGAVFLLFISIFSSFMDYLAIKLGFLSTVNFVFFFFIGFLILIVFNQTIKISQLNEKIKNLNHYIALKEKKEEEK
ncbi:MAG: DUF2304 domain-containing protein [Erysipelotrichaceae bacterium]|nr:DUF2304 domain-containing protein [Erysipelotrichaceae bacterium]